MSRGPGRPGWHVECAAIALNRLGTQIDVQGGGSDLLFPHHEFGAAHAEALTGVHPFARPYCHAGMIGLCGDQMSKSRGTGISPELYLDLGLNPEWLRYYIAAKLNNQVEDLAFHPDDFIARGHSDL